MAVVSLSEAPRDEPLEKAVAIERVSKTFGTRDSVQALGEVTLDIGVGEFVAIVGPSGCGKSTLLNMIAGLLPPTTGRIEVLSRHVTGPVDDLGIVFQQHLLLPWRTILENVLLQIEVRRMGRREHKERALSLLERVGLADFASSYPDQLSGGINQRAAICRALVHDPELLIMDEPFGALDAMTRDQMAMDFHLLSREARKTIIFVTHSISEAVFLANRVAVMSPRPGRIQSIVSIDLGRERHFEMKEDRAFAVYTRQIRQMFESMGVLREMARR